MSQDQKKDGKAEPKKESKSLDWNLLKLVFPYLAKHKFLVFFSIVFLLAGDFLSLTLPWLTRHGIDVNIANKDLHGLAVTTWLFAGALVAGFLFQTTSNYSIAFLGQKLLFALRLDVFKKVLGLGNDYFDKNPTGGTLTHVTNDVEAVRQFISEGLVSVLGDLLKVVLILVAMFLVNAYLAIWAVISIPLFLLATILFRNAIRNGFRGVRKASSQINTAMVESLNGHKEIALFNNRGETIRKFSILNSNYLESYRQVVDAYALYFPVIEIVTQVSMIAILAYTHFGMGKTVKIGEVFALFAYVNMFFRPLRDLAENFNTFQSAMAAMERIKKILAQPVSIADPPEPVNLPTAFRGEIVFDKVNFAYSPETPILKDLSFTIRPGEKIAIVGSTGAGKSTMIALLNRLYDIQSGSVSIDGVDVRKMRVGDLRKRIATVPQDVFLFTGTIGENVSLYDPNVSPEEIRRACQAVNASAFIEKLGKGYDENVLEDGQSLSTGQKQLLSFARAFVKNPSIVILDEATANIDSESEALIEESLSKLLEGRTGIIIAHRLSTIRSVDRILVLHQGRLAEEGTHDELVKKQGLYNQLYQMQALALG